MTRISKFGQTAWKRTLKLRHWKNTCFAMFDIFWLCRTYRAVLQARLHTCDTILSQTSTLLSRLNSLKLGFSSVAEQTAAFQSQCDNLVQEEVELPSNEANVRNNSLTMLINWLRIYNPLNRSNLYLANWMHPAQISSPNPTSSSLWNASTRASSSSKEMYFPSCHST